MKTTLELFSHETFGLLLNMAKCVFGVEKIAQQKDSTYDRELLSMYLSA